MGLTLSALRFIVREHRRKPFYGSVLTLGRQGIAATTDEALRMLAREGVVPAAAPAAELSRLTGAGTRRRQSISDSSFFRLLGADEVLALDYSDYEGAELIHDLNRPVPRELWGRFDLIVDGGTIEHVFDVRQSLANIALMLRPGGRVLHISPANNYANHGFYQLSPTLFFDYYGANGFTNLRGFVAEQDTHLYDVRPWDVFEVTPGAGRMTSLGSLMVLFAAEKTAASTADKIPIQSFYKQMHQEQTSALSARTITGVLKQMLPDRLKILLARTFPFLDPMRRPWGMRRCGRW